MRHQLEYFICIVSHSASAFTAEGSNPEDHAPIIVGLLLVQTPDVPHGRGLVREPPVAEPAADILFLNMTVAYSDSHPITLYVVQGRAKPVLRGPNGTEPNLFQHGETTYGVG